jgi:hypothetical protein
MHSNGYNYSKRRFIRPINDLLLDQRKGKFLTPEEKQELKKYAEERRLKNKNK